MQKAWTLNVAHATNFLGPHLKSTSIQNPWRGFVQLKELCYMIIIDDDIVALRRTPVPTYWLGKVF